MGVTKLENNQNMYIVGKSGCGKTSLVKKIVIETYNGKNKKMRFLVMTPKKRLENTRRSYPGKTFLPVFSC